MSASLPDAAVARVQAFWTAVRLAYPTGVSMQVSNLVEIVDPVDGKVLATQVSATATPLLHGTAGALIGPPSLQILVKWLTSTFLAGRRLQGRSFLGPVTYTAITGTGTVDAIVLAAVNVAAANLAAVGGAAPALLVWRRPRAVKPATHPATFDRDGDTGQVTGTLAPAKFATLKSRRD
jgi:hypothetical protein